MLISTHAPLAGRDVGANVFDDIMGEFQPTRPLRGATCYYCGAKMDGGFQPTRPLRGAT